MKETEQRPNKSEKKKNNRLVLPEWLIKLKKRALHNVGWKIVSLISAFIVWMAIMNIDDPYITVTIENIPVVVQNETALQEQGKISDIESGRTISVRARAPRSVADNLTAADFAAVADYRQMSLVYAVPIQVSVNAESAYVKEDITISSRSPEVMILTLEDYVEETFRVDIQTEGEAASGYYVSDMVVKPNLITISGSVKQIDRIEKVVVEVNIANAARSFEAAAEVKAYDKNGYEIEADAIEYETTEVEVEVTVLPVKRILLLISIEGEPGYGYECTGEQHVPTEITIAGTAEDLQEIYSLTIPFDISMQSEDVEARLNIESYLTEYYGDKYVLVDEDNYVTVKAVIEKIPTTDIKISSANIEVRGLPENYHLIFTTRSDINIKVLGSEEELEKLTPQTLRLYIDVSDYEPGSYYISVYSDTEADVTVRTGTVGIEITDVSEAFEVTDGEDSDIN